MPFGLPVRHATQGEASRPRNEPIPCCHSSNSNCHGGIDAWNDDSPTAEDVDCILTLHYDNPLNEPAWKSQAQRVCDLLKLRQLNGRSKGVILSMSRSGEGNVKTGSNGNHDNNTIRDTVFLSRPQVDDNDNEWNVSLQRPTPSKPKEALNTLPVEGNDTPPDLVLDVLYEKPETAFYHPNANAMAKALQWMLDRLTDIQRRRHKHYQPQLQPQPSRGLRLLEMYCGCGAHTVALGRTGLLSKILAVELDPRLVQACLRNVELNGLQSLVEVRRGDAGKWAKDEERRQKQFRTRNEQQQQQQHDESNNHQNQKIEDPDVFNVLLVDPPRQGLDDHVIRMAVAVTTLEDFLYISCGHHALLRDLEKLSPTFEVMNCVQMDLFPRTDSIETLVHLRRR